MNLLNKLDGLQAGGASLGENLRLCAQLADDVYMTSADAQRQHVTQAADSLPASQ